MGDSRLVYSSESGRICPECSHPLVQCICRKKQPTPAGDGVVRIRRESKGRGGKTVSVITGLALGEDALKAIAGELKKRCGSGGTVKDNVIEIQGDHRVLLLGELTRRGYTVKLAGG
jgi:translation initiation factor 1